MAWKRGVLWRRLFLDGRCLNIHWATMSPRHAIRRNSFSKCAELNGDVIVAIIRTLGFGLMNGRFQEPKLGIGAFRHRVPLFWYRVSSVIGILTFRYLMSESPALQQITRPHWFALTLHIKKTSKIGKCAGTMDDIATCKQILHSLAASCVQSRQFFASMLCEQLFE